MQLSYLSSNFLSQQVREHFKNEPNQEQLKILLTNSDPSGDLDKDAGLFNAMLLLDEVDEFADKLTETGPNQAKILDRICSLGDFSTLAEVQRWIKNNWKCFTHKQHETIKFYNSTNVNPDLIYFGLQLSRLIDQT